MPDNTVLNPGVGGNTIRDEDIGGIHFPVAKIILGAPGVNAGPVAAGNPLPITALVPIPVIGAVTVGAVDQGAGAGPGGFWAVRLSDGGAFYDSPLRTQLPAALVGGRLSVDVGASALPLGAATEATALTLATEATLATLGTEATLVTRLADATFTARINTLGQKAMAGSTPVVFASDQSSLPVTGTISIIPVSIGVQGNAWSAASVGVGGTSASVDTQYTPHLSIFGNADAATTIILEYSQDDASFYAGPTLTIPALGSDFWSDVTVGARYVRLRSTAAATITATIAGKT